MCSSDDGHTDVDAPARVSGWIAQGSRRSPLKSRSCRGYNVHRLDRLDAMTLGRIPDDARVGAGLSGDRVVARPSAAMADDLSLIPQRPFRRRVRQPARLWSRSTATATESRIALHPRASPPAHPCPAPTTTSLNCVRRAKMRQAGDPYRPEKVHGASLGSRSMITARNT